MYVRSNKCQTYLKIFWNENKVVDGNYVQYLLNTIHFMKVNKSESTIKVRIKI